MSGTSSIEWTDKTWNPVRGCSIVSPGCTNCYAMKFAHRFHGSGQAYEGLTMMTKGGPVWTGKVRLVENELHAPYHWKKPSRIFVNSMSDLFHEDVPDDFIARVWFAMACNQQHVFQILTKRPARMLEWVSRKGQDAVFAGEREEYEAASKKHGWPLRNVWLGVSVEDQVRADERIPLLLMTPAAVRWISAEPLLGSISLCPDTEIGPLSWLKRHDIQDDTPTNRIDWVVAGGESGPGARPMHPAWARSLRDQCAAASVPFFFKQWGHYYAGGERAVWVSDEASPAQFPDGTVAWPCGKKAAGRQLDGRTHDEYPA